ncbi:hypothetical protein [Algoriphagus machipongonensis]|uniref:Uncharacterized protein n=1 Tax=Algoriphagus machipongonensis TaxID=388413 RepID=A3HYC6_9BACT|nr:hypothetical protein [Algoriphagus machipongonensis]EAZ80262.1 hypothetical protein ALPR1_05050 [Algoriphagus machipongonensis]
MKRPFLFLAAMLIAISSYSQNLTGPKAKNAKISEKTKNSIAVVYYDQPQDLKGPAAKNAKIWDKSGKLWGISTRKNINNPKGLKAKNRKVWEDPEFAATGSKASYKLPKSMRKRKFWWH